QWIGAAFAVAATTLYLRAFLAPDRAGSTSGRRAFLWAATALMTVVIAARAVQLGAVPLFSPLEALYTYAWLVFLVYLLLVQSPNRASVGPLLVPFGTACSVVGMFGFTSDAVNPLFKNPLFSLHTLSAFLGYSALSVACCAGILYLVLYDNLAHKRVGALAARLPSLEDLDGLGNRTVILGLSFLTVSLAAGVAWARREWGVVWIWEPKGIWVLFTWAVYAFYLVARNGAGWRGVRAAWLSAVGFAASIFTLLGTNYLLGWGRHVFQ